MYFRRYFLQPVFLVSFIALLSCSNGTKHPESKKQISKKEIGYDFKKPDKTIPLRKGLREISGISFYSDSVLVVEEDEDAILYFISLNTGDIIKQFSFGKRGDFEDIAVVGDTAYVLRSDGKLFEVSPLSGTQTDINVNKYETGLSGKNNTEGLFYDATQKLFLIACKGNPGSDKKYENKKAIYTYNLQSTTLSGEPFILVDNSEVLKKAGFGTTETLMKELEASYKTSDGEFSFQPSGIAIHPLTGEIYILSSVGKLLAVLDKEGKILHVYKLPLSVFNGPEGIAFDTVGNLFISNEGDGGRGNILEFKYQEHEK